MKRWYFTTDVERASGWQQWYVDADSLDDAKHKQSIGEAEFYDEEVEVTSLSDPQWDEEGKDIPNG